MKVLDAGCGGGRNLIYLMREGIEVYGVDQSQVAHQVVLERARTLARRRATLDPSPWR